jgi:uncharacterized protein YeeX (DUF496 family)
MGKEYEDIETTPDAEEETAQFQSTTLPDDGDEAETAVDVKEGIGGRSIEEEVAEFEKEAGDGIEEPPEETPSETVEAEGRGEKIPDEFSDLALKLMAQGKVFASADEIETFATDYSDEQLLEMIPHLKEQLKEEAAAAKKPPAKPAAKVEKPTAPDLTGVDDAKLKAIREEIRKEFREELDSLKQSLSTVQEDTAVKELIHYENMANDFFDRMDSEQIGKTAELPKYPSGQYVQTDPRFKARSQIYDMAMLLRGNGQSFDKALMNAAAWFRGLNLEAETERKVIKKVRDNQKRLSPERYNVVTQPVYESEEDRRAAVVREAAEAAGLNKFD